MLWYWHVARKGPQHEDDDSQAQRAEHPCVDASAGGAEDEGDQADEAEPVDEADWRQAMSDFRSPWTPPTREEREANIRRLSALLRDSLSACICGRHPSTHEPAGPDSEDDCPLCGLGDERPWDWDAHYVYARERGRSKS
jgi:hypothetical protein